MLVLLGYFLIAVGAGVAASEVIGFVLTSFSQMIAKSFPLNLGVHSFCEIR